MAKLNSYRITLRHPQGVTHAQTLDAPSRQEAERLSRLEAASMMGGEAEAWAVSSSEQLAGALVRRAA